MKKKNKLETIKVPLAAALDRTNQMLKNRFGLTHINYVTDNSIIQHGWLISNDESIEEAILLLKKQNAPIYILGQLASAIIGWNSMHTKMVGSLWKNEVQIDAIETDSFDDIKKKIIVWYQDVSQSPLNKFRGLSCET